MAKSNKDITYGAAQARVSEDDALRIRYKAGTPLEGGKIADSQPVDLFSAAHKIGGQHQQENEGKIADSETADLHSSAHNVEEHKEKEQQNV